MDTKIVTRVGVEDREISALVKAGHELGCNELPVTTWEHEGDEFVKGKRIVYRQLWKWL